MPLNGWKHELPCTWQNVWKIRAVYISPPMCGRIWHPLGTTPETISRKLADLEAQDIFDKYQAENQIRTDGLLIL